MSSVMLIHPRNTQLFLKTLHSLININMEHLQLSDDQIDLYLSVRHFPWLNSSFTTCQNLSTTLSPHSTFSSLIALASIPSSGNTWVRSIIEEATGIFTGSMYKVQNFCRFYISMLKILISGPDFGRKRILWRTLEVEWRRDFGYQDTWIYYRKCE